MDRYDKIEICNLLFGCSRGEHLFPEREIEGSVEWRALCGVLGIDSYGHTRKDNPHRNARGGYDDIYVLTEKGKQEAGSILNEDWET